MVLIMNVILIVVALTMVVVMEVLLFVVVSDRDRDHGSYDQSKHNRTCDRSRIRICTRDRYRKLESSCKHSNAQPTRDYH